MAIFKSRFTPSPRTKCKSRHTTAEHLRGNCRSRRFHENGHTQCTHSRLCFRRRIGRSTHRHSLRQYLYAQQRKHGSRYGSQWNRSRHARQIPVIHAGDHAGDGRVSRKRRIGKLAAQSAHSRSYGRRKSNRPQSLRFGQSAHPYGKRGHRPKILRRHSR